MKLILQINLPGSAAPNLLAPHYVRMLKEIAGCTNTPTIEAPIRDVKGAYIGFWQITESNAS